MKKFILIYASEKPQNFPKVTNSGFTLTFTSILNLILEKKSSNFELLAQKLYDIINLLKTK